MLVTDPKQRATLVEIMNHPWMTKGFNGPPENYLPAREPLQLPLDTAVIHKMTGFDFGSPEYITTQLTKILESEEYQRAVRNAARKQAQMPDPDRSRGILGFYKRRNSATSRDTLTNPSNEAIPLGYDPVNAFSPLISIYYLVREKMEKDRLEANPGASSTVSPTEKPLPIPDLPAPPAAHTNSATYEMQGEATGGRSRPRARTRGEDEIAPNAEKARLPSESQPAPAPSASPAPVAPPGEPAPKKESTAGAILRRISTRRRKPEVPDKEAKQPPTPSLAVTAPADADAATPKKSYSIRRPRMEEIPSSSSLKATGSKKEHPEELLTPPASGGEGQPRRFLSLRRAASVDRRRLTRRGAETYPEPPATSGSDGSSKIQKAKTQEAPADDSRRGTGAARTKSLGHARRESIQARRARREEAREHDLVKEETDAELAETRRHQEAGEPDESGIGESLKPVYLKGLFSVSTTSSKSLPFIRNDIIRVLRSLGVAYTEIKGGFRCRHSPSFKVENSPPGDRQPATPGLHPSSAGPSGERTHRRKISFTGFKNSSDKERDEGARGTPLTPKTPSAARGSHGSPAISDTESESNVDERLAGAGSSRHAGAGRTGTSGRDAGATSTHVRDEMMARNMVLTFEIFIVKVPLLSLHGIQFKKGEGNIMYYKNMAQEILNLLRL
jgi:hypothetical protein